MLCSMTTQVFPEEWEASEVVLQCFACKQLLPSTRFVREGKSRTGYQARCKECQPPRNPLVGVPCVRGHEGDRDQYGSCRACMRENSRIRGENKGLRKRRTKAEYEAVPEGSKICSRCDEVKEVKEFYVLNKGKSGVCKICRKEDSLRYNLRDSALRSKYGISEQDYFEMLDEQGGTCAICTATPGEQRFGVLEIDHDHLTKKVRGLLCHPCNIAIGKFQENPQRLMRAAEYLLLYREKEEQE